MARLLERSLRDMYRAGEIFTFLMPAAEAIYLPHDFRTVYEQERKFYEETSETPGISISQATEEDLESLSLAANTWLERNYQVYALRDAALLPETDERIRK